MKLKSINDFINDLVNTFPEIKEEVLDEDYEGLIALQIGCFMRFINNAINANDLVLFKKCMDFIQENINIVDKRIENSLVISCLGKLKIPKKSQIEGLIPKELKGIIETLEAYYDSILKDEKFQKYLEELEK
jgi:hypothetical protein